MALKLNTIAAGPMGCAQAGEEIHGELAAHLEQHGTNPDEFQRRRLAMEGLDAEISTVEPAPAGKPAAKGRGKATAAKRETR